MDNQKRELSRKGETAANECDYAVTFKFNVHEIIEEIADPGNVDVVAIVEKLRLGKLRNINEKKVVTETMKMFHRK